MVQNVSEHEPMWSFDQILRLYYSYASWNAYTLYISLQDFIDWLVISIYLLTLPVALWAMPPEDC